MTVENTENAKQPWEGPARLTDDQIREFVLGVCDGHIFTSYQIKDVSLLGTVFMPLAFGALAGADEEAVKKIGCFYERIDQASPMGVNGYPTFFSVRIMHVEDWDRAFVAIRKEFERRKGIEV